MTYIEWATKHPHAAAELQALLGAAREPPPVPSGGKKNESWSQQHVRLRAARQGAMAWRNNVGATPAKTQHSCPRCHTRFEEKHQPIRYGLANDSARLNGVVKSSDLILAIPRVIRPEDVGNTIAQFGSVETKRPGWVFTGKGPEAGQAAWLALLESIGAYARFSTGELTL